METPLLVALIGAGGTVLAATVTVILTRVLSAKAAATHTDATARRSVPRDATGIEQLMRQDPRVQRLLNNGSWKDAAEAAIANLCRGVECPVESRKKSSTWRQVNVVFDELCVNQT